MLKLVPTLDLIQGISMRSQEILRSIEGTHTTTRLPMHLVAASALRAFAPQLQTLRDSGGGGNARWTLPAARAP